MDRLEPEKNASSELSKGRRWDSGDPTKTVLIGQDGMRRYSSDRASHSTRRKRGVVSRTLRAHRKTARLAGMCVALAFVSNCTYSIVKPEFMAGKSEDHYLYPKEGELYQERNHDWWRVYPVFGDVMLYWNHSVQDVETNE